MKLMWQIGVVRIEMEFYKVQKIIGHLELCKYLQIACVLVVLVAGNLKANILDEPSVLVDVINNEIPSIDTPMKQNCDCMKAQTIKNEVLPKIKLSPHAECQKDTVMVDDEMLTGGNEEIEEIVEEDTVETDSVEEDILIEDVVEEVEEVEQPEVKQMNEKLQAPQKVVKQKYKTIDESIETIEQLVDSGEEPAKPLDAKKVSKSAKSNKLKIKSGKPTEKKVQKPKKSAEKVVASKKTSKPSGKYDKNSANTNKKNKQKTTKTNEKSKKSNKSKKTKSKKNEL